jgi:hypothetical protein
VDWRWIRSTFENANYQRVTFRYLRSVGDAHRGEFRGRHLLFGNRQIAQPPFSQSRGAGLGWQWNASMEQVDEDRNLLDGGRYAVGLGMEI